MKVSKDPGDLIITHSLGPCIGVVLRDPVSKASGLLHFQLSASKGHEAKAQTHPYMFADTGIPALFSAVERIGGSKNRWEVSIFGGASMLKDDEVFKIGVKNSRAAKKLLWQACMTIKYEDVGGTSSRTVGIEVDTGNIRLHKDGKVYIF